MAQSTRSRVTSRTPFCIPLSPDIHRDPPQFFPFHVGVPRDERGSGARGSGRRKKKEDANQMCRQRRRHQKRVASGPCHQLALSFSLSLSRRAHRPRLYLNALSSEYATMTSTLFWNPRRPTRARRGGV